ncbi:hypothetical protein B0181_02445 [Moraxella caviae]|uniref:Cyn operon transcriptional activator n=1 Tax=Moraxella caviae TaxID=34060 RepID=A0A1T0A8G8_9GAMM|nr:LysR family transcriptional regulator [Moraxella caviae]OOR91909.1 hypothetical protein B0181_02445 [Moraxella caviae]STZ09764.1 Cyn operon transcriptional activator [Moraxella caviae]
MKINSKNITLRQLRAFLAVADSGSFTQAADDLHISQSTLSGLIKELEKVLAVKLFDRTTRQLSLSAIGVQLYPLASRVLHDLEAMTNELNHLKALEKGVVRIAASQQLAAAILPQVMADFEALYPNIDVLIEDCAVEDVIGLVGAGVVDFGIGPARDVGQGIMRELLLNLPFYVAMPQTHPLAAKTQVAWSDLRHEKLIVLTGSFSDMLAAELPDEMAAMIKNAAHRVNFMTTAFAMASKNLGLTFCLPYSQARIKQNGLQMRPLINPQISRSSYLYRQSGRVQTDAARRFYGVLCEQLSKAQW